MLIMANFRPKKSIAMLASVAMVVLASTSVFAWTVPIDPKKPTPRPPGDPRTGAATMDFVPQNYGIYDTYYDYFREPNCRECHSGSVADRHHSTKWYSQGDCLYCHCGWPDVVPPVRDCQLCHTDDASPCGVPWPPQRDGVQWTPKGSPHHRSAAAALKNCTSCHNPNFLVTTNTVEPPEYAPSKITPTPQACENCHWQTNCSEAPTSWKDALAWDDPRTEQIEPDIYTDPTKKGGTRSHNVAVDDYRKRLFVGKAVTLATGVGGPDRFWDTNNPWTAPSNLSQKPGAWSKDCYEDADLFAQVWDRWPQNDVRRGERIWVPNSTDPGDPNDPTAKDLMHLGHADDLANATDGLPRPSGLDSGIFPAPIMANGDQGQGIMSGSNGGSYQVGNKKAFLARTGTHHELGVGPLSMGKVVGDCTTCHADKDFDQFMHDPTNREAPVYIRYCQNCHDITTLHVGIKEHVYGGDIYAVGGVINSTLHANDKCVGCHGSDMPAFGGNDPKVLPVIERVEPPFQAPGKLITIYGTDFGASGNVYLKRPSTGDWVQMPVDKDGWNDTFVRFKVQVLQPDGQAGQFDNPPFTTQVKIVRGADQVESRPKGDLLVVKDPEVNIVLNNDFFNQSATASNNTGNWGSDMYINGVALCGGGVGKPVKDDPTMEKIGDKGYGWSTYVVIALSNDHYRLTDFKAHYSDQLKKMVIKASLTEGSLYDVWTGRQVPLGQLYNADWMVYVITDYFKDDGDGVYFDRTTGKIDLANYVDKNLGLPTQLGSGGVGTVRDNMLDNAFNGPDQKPGKPTTGDQLVARVSSASKVDAKFNIVFTPSIRAISPTQACTGSLVKINGLGFGNTPGKIQISDRMDFNDPEAVKPKAFGKVIAWGATKITFQMPELPMAGPAYVRLILDGLDESGNQRVVPPVFNVCDDLGAECVGMSGAGLTQCLEDSGSECAGMPDQAAQALCVKEKVTCKNDMAAKSRLQKVIDYDPFICKPAIESITPSEVTVTSKTDITKKVLVTLLGTGFKADKGKVLYGTNYNTVSEQAAVKSWTERDAASDGRDKIEFMMPLAAAGNYFVRVELAEKNPYTGDPIRTTERIMFPVGLLAPKITTVAPASTFGGQQVTLFGTDFGNSAAGAKVELSTEFADPQTADILPAKIVKWTNDSIVINAPSVSGTYFARINLGANPYDTTKTILSNTKKLVVAKPQIADVSSLKVRKGATLKIIGNGFLKAKGKVWLGDDFALTTKKAATILKWNQPARVPEVIVVKIPATTAPGTYFLRVQIAAKDSNGDPIFTTDRIRIEVVK